MKQNKVICDKDTFYIVGRVHISEWDWKKEFANLAKALRKYPSTMVSFDVGKIMGIVSALDSIQKELIALKLLLHDSENR